MKVLHSPEVHLMVVKDVEVEERSQQLRNQQLLKQEKLPRQERHQERPQERLHAKLLELAKNAQRAQRKPIN